MRVARETALLSYAVKLKVGAVAVRDGRIICTGYNGTGPGEDNCCEIDTLADVPVETVRVAPGHPYQRFGMKPYGETTTTRVLMELDAMLEGKPTYWFLKTKPNVTHAEKNLIDFAARKGIALEGAELYGTHSPCMQCAQSIANVGFVAVYYGEPFNHVEGLQYLEDKRGVNVYQVGLPEDPAAERPSPGLAQNPTQQSQGI